MHTSAPFIDDATDHRVCWFCPSLRLPAGGFDVLERPHQDYPFDPADGFRYHRVTRVPACVHPEKVGLAAGKYRSEGRLPQPPSGGGAARQTPPDEPSAPDTSPAATPSGAAWARQLADRRTQRRARRTTRAAQRHELTPFEGPLPPGVPDRIEELAPWIRSLLTAAPSDGLAEVLAGAEAAARQRFPDEAVLHVLRGVLADG